jgi:hypothetical protein
MSAAKRLPPGAFLAFSLVVHVAFLLGMPSAESPDARLLDLPSNIELGIEGEELGGEPAPAPAPPPAEKAKPKPSDKPKPTPPKPDPDAVTLPLDAGAPVDGGAANDASDGDAATGSPEGVDGGEPAAVSGDGIFAGADGTGGYGPGGNGTGMYAPAGATIALNVNMQRVRDSAMLLEAESLLSVIPEWELLLAGSGLDPEEDFDRVFVASPNLMRSSLVVAASFKGGRARIERAVAALAKEQGESAVFSDVRGFPVAPWWNRGPTPRVIALVAEDQLVITRKVDLGRVLQIARALQKQRAREGFSKAELEKSGGLLAMRADETVALWVEGVRRYAPGAEQGVPLSMRMSANYLDQFNTELRATGRYESAQAAAAALGVVDEKRKAWLDHPRVQFLGLKSALDTAELQHEGEALSLRMQLTLHQTRFLLAYVSRVLTPRDAVAKPPP